MVSSNTDVHPALLDLAVALKGHDMYADTEVMEFNVGDLFVLATIDQGKSRLRVRVYLPTDDEQLVTDWVYRQPAQPRGSSRAATSKTNSGAPGWCSNDPLLRATGLPTPFTTTSSASPRLG